MGGIFHTNSIPLLEKLYAQDKSKAYKSILENHSKNQGTIVNFLYFARAMKHRLFEAREKSLDKEFYRSLLRGDFLFPDGIALEVFYSQAKKSNTKIKKTGITNLNGTDFLPFFFKKICQEEKKLHIALYSTYDPKIGKDKNEMGKAKKNFGKKFEKNIDFSDVSAYSQRGKNFDFTLYEESINTKNADINIFVCCIGTPFQEIRVEEHKAFFEKHNVIVFNAGGFVDFLSGFEKRAPEWVVKARVLETFWRVITNPQKNLKKFLDMFGIIRFLFKKLGAKVQNILLKK